MTRSPVPEGPHRLAWEAEHRGDLETAAYWYEEHAREAHNAGRQEVEFLATSNLAEMLARSGQIQRAVEVATRLLAEARKAQLGEFEMRATGRLVEALLSADPRNRWGEIKPLLQNGLKLAKQTSIVYWEIYFNILMANGFIHVRDLDNAYSCLQEASNIIYLETFDRAHMQAYISCSLSLLMLKRQKYSEAQYYAEQAVGTAREDGVLDFMAQAELLLAQTIHVQGQRADALALVENVCAEASRFKWKGIEQTAEYLRGELAREMGYLEMAENAAQRSLTLAREMKAKEKQVESLLSHGRILLALGRKEEAKDTLGQARRLSQEQDYEDHFSQAEELLANSP